MEMLTVRGTQKRKKLTSKRLHIMIDEKKETIEVAAMMKLRGSDKEKLLKVDSIIAKLKLDNC